MKKRELQTLHALLDAVRTLDNTKASDYEVMDARRAVLKKLASMLDEKPKAAEKDTVPF